LLDDFKNCFYLNKGFSKSKTIELEQGPPTF